MKTLALLSSAIVLSALAVSPAGFEAAVSALFVTGFLAIALSDYARRSRPLVTELAMLAAPRGERLGLAA